MSEQYIQEEELTQPQIFNLIASEKINSPHVQSECDEKEFYDYLVMLYAYFMDNWKGFSQQDDEDLIQSFNQFNNTTNNVKNVIKAFIKYMTSTNSDGLVLECIDTLSKSSFDIIKQFKRFCDRHQVNNNYLQRIIKNERYGKQFQYFLQIYAIEWLYKSRVKDKVIHLLVILFLSRCFTNHDLLNNVAFYKKLHIAKIPKTQPADTIKKEEKE
ncbi:hypothetical protein ABPG72_022309 [Tetrahymena utriculariae]